MALVHLDQGLPGCGTVDHLIDALGRPLREVGDDKADVKASSGQLDAGAAAALEAPGLCLELGLGEAAQRGLLVECPPGPDVVGGGIDEAVEYAIAGLPET